MNMDKLLKKTLENQVQKSEEGMFKITSKQYEQDREQFENLADDDKIFVTKYFKILQAIETIEKDIKRVATRDSSSGQINLQTNQRETFLKIKNEMNDELKPHLFDFIKYHEEKSQLRNPKKPSLN